MTRFARLPQGLLAVTLIVGLAWFLLAGDAMQKAAAPRPGANNKPVKQLALEFAGSADAGIDLLHKWGDDAPARVRNVIYLDFDFIPGYVLLVGSLVLLVSRSVGPDARVPAGALFWMVIAAGLLDVVENCLMLWWLPHPHSTTPLPLARLASFAKWGLLILALAGSLYNMVRRRTLIADPAPLSPSPGS